MRLPTPVYSQFHAGVVDGQTAGPKYAQNGQRGPIPSNWGDHALKVHLGSQEQPSSEINQVKLTRTPLNTRGMSFKINALLCTVRARRICNFLQAQARHRARPRPVPTV